MKWMHQVRPNSAATFLSYLSGIAASGALNILAGEKMCSIRWVACVLLLAGSCFLFLTGAHILKAKEDAVYAADGTHWSSYFSKRHYAYALIGLISLLLGLAALFF